MTTLERALYSAAKAFVAAMDDGAPAQSTQSAQPVATNNGIPKCSIHGKYMKLASEKSRKYAGPLGYKCTAKNDDDTWCTQKA